MPSDRYTVTRIRKDYLEKLEALVEKNKDTHDVNNKVKMLHRLIDQGLRDKPKYTYKPKPKPPKPEELAKPAGLPPP